MADGVTYNKIVEWAIGIKNGTVRSEHIPEGHCRDLVQMELLKPQYMWTAEERKARGLKAFVGHREVTQ